MIYYNFYLQVIIFHKDFSQDNGKFSLFALKVLSRFCGGYSMPLNAEKVIMVEKQFALRVFGIGFGCQALRSSYYLSYTAQAIAAGIKEPENLHPYGKRHFMRTRKIKVALDVLLAKENLLGIELMTEDKENEGEGRPPKKMKPTSSSPLAPSPES